MDTFQTTIDLPAVITFRRAGYDMTVRLTDLPPEILAQAIPHGITQTVGDAASAATSGHYEMKRPDDSPDWKALPKEEKSKWSLAHAMEIAEYGKVLMEKRVDALCAGEWQSRGSAVAGLDAEATEVAEYMLAQGMVDRPKGAKRADVVRMTWEAFEGLDDETQSAIRAGLEASKLASKAMPKIKLG
jgi:hypothetical protein